MRFNKGMVGKSWKKDGGCSALNAIPIAIPKFRNPLVHE